MNPPPLERIKPEIRAVEGYHLKAYDCPIKLNQNESPFDVPEGLKNQILEIVRQDMADAKTLGVRRTPTFFVNGKPLPSFGLPQLQTLVEAEIATNYGG